MADNVTADAGSGGAVLAMREVTHGGDTAQLAGAWIAGITGTEGSYTFAAINGSAANGLEVDVTRLSALVAGSATIGEVTIGAATGAAGDLAKAEDAVHGSGDIGVMSLAVRNDVLAALAGTDGDYAPFQVNALGALYTDDVSTKAALSGSEFQVDIVAALPAGTNAIGKLAANSGVDIGDVDVTTYPGPADAKFATLGQKNKAGSMPVTLATDEDALNVIATNAGTFIVQEDGAALTALQLIDDTVAVLGTATYSEATTKGNVIGAVRNDALATLVNTDNEIGPLQLDELGALWVQDAPNTIDTGNSTTSTLTSASTFTGTGMDVLKYAAITIQIFADQDGADAGMRFEFSSDGTNWDLSHRHDYKANTGRAFQFSSHANFFRVVFINGGTGQGEFRLQTILHRQTPNTTVHRLDETLAPDRSATVMKASIMAQAAGSGNFVPVDATAGGNLKVAVEEFDGPLAAGTNLIGDVGISVRTSGGTTPYKNIDVDAKDEVKATAGQVYWIHAINTTDAVVFLKFYDLAAASVTVGTTVPDLTFPVPANADSDGAGFTLAIPNGIAFGTGITIAGTLLVADNDNTALGANALIVNLGFA